MVFVSVVEVMSEWVDGTGRDGVGGGEVGERGEGRQRVGGSNTLAAGTAITCITIDRRSDTKDAH